jgi:hypothetical protein
MYALAYTGAIALADGEVGSTLAQAVGEVTGALNSIVTTVTGNYVLMIGIAGALVATGIGLFKSLTGQKTRRGRP